MDNKKRPINKRLNKLFNGIQYEEPETEPRKKENKVAGQGGSESTEINAQVSESALGESEAQASDLNAQDELIPSEANAQVEETGPSESEAQASDSEDEGIVQTDASDASSSEPPKNEMDLSPEDLLEEVRHSLIEVQEADNKKPKWWQRFGGGSRKNKKEIVTPAPVKTVAEPDAPITRNVPVEPPAMDSTKQDEYVEQLDELIDMLEEETHEEVVDAKAIVPHGEESTPDQEPETQNVADVEELKKRAFHARTTPEEEERALSEVRSVALAEGEEVFIEVEAKAEDPMQDRMKALENALKPYRRYFYFVFIFVSIVMVLIVSASLIRLYLQSLPPPPVEEAPALPYPVGMNLPGGLNFHLKMGKLQDGRWDPLGPEWLEGTEVCRWIAIPYSRQLEAVVRTLTQEDQIQLTMSNNDTLTYNVYSINQLTIEDMQQLDSGSPCLLLVLAQSGTDERWVVTAYP